VDESLAAPVESPVTAPHSRRFRRWMLVLFLIAIAVAIALLLFLRNQSPPQAVRLLPESDAIIYFNVGPIRKIADFSSHPVQHDADYQSFIDATGIQFERDLDSAAIAVNRLAGPAGLILPAQAYGFSEVMVGKFNAARLANYLQAQSASTENYAGHTIYVIPHEGRTVRAAILGKTMVAASNMPTPEQIHHILDSYASSSLSAPTLVKENYSRVPALASAWAIAAIGVTENGNRFDAMGLPVRVPAGTILVGSLRYLGSIHLRIEEIAPTTSDAELSAATVRAGLALLHVEQSLQSAIGQSDPNTQAMFASIAVSQKDNRAVLTATVPVPVLQKLLTPQK
jgi:hypothetical protein